jgi:hypothetical protein
MVNDDRLIIKGNDGMEIYKSDLQMVIEDGCQELGIEDLTKEGQRRWKALMTFIGKRLFPDEARDYIYKYGTRNSKYNYDIISELYTQYIYLSDKYNKLISVVAFERFINAPEGTVTQWAYDEPNCVGNRIYKNLLKGRLDCIKDKAADNGNVTGIMFVGNAEFGLNLPGVSREQSQRPQALTASDLLQASRELCKNDTQLIDSSTDNPQ